MTDLIYLDSLGCDKNLVDSQVMLGMLTLEEGYRLTNQPTEATVIIVNTCSFIHDAKEQSIEHILDYATLKNEGRLKVLIVTGCLSELYRQAIVEEIPEVDGVLGATNYDKIGQLVKDSLIMANSRKADLISMPLSKRLIFDSPDYIAREFSHRQLNPTTAYAFLKIAEGCDQHCTYCIIPHLRGCYRSRAMEDILAEATYLAEQGKQEIILVAQDVGKYGLDRYGYRRLVDLLDGLSAIPTIHWLRLLYVYPEDITDDLVTAMASNPKVVHYLDMPLQHSHDTILRKMARQSREITIRSTIAKLRQVMPDICIRTTFIVGFPGETEEHFQHLNEFVQSMTLDRVGVFTYSREDKTPAAKMRHQVKEEVKQERQAKLLETQQRVSRSNNQKMLGRTVEVLIEDEKTQEAVYVGRSYKDMPEIDSLVFVKSDHPLVKGQFVEVTITAFDEYDLFGQATIKSSTLGVNKNSPLKEVGNEYCK